MSIYDDIDTLCNRELNRCKLREKCKRYDDARGGMRWEANYWVEFGKRCPHFIPIPKEKVKPHAEVRKASEES